MSVVIQKSNLDDSSKILHLSTLLDVSELNKEGKIKYALENSLIWVAKDGDKIAGYILCEFFDADHKELPNSVFISDLLVLEPYRKQGIGSRLVQMVLETSFPEQFDCFSVTHDPREEYLTDFYKSFGFEVVGKTKAGNVKMIKNKSMECRQKINLK